MYQYSSIKRVNAKCICMPNASVTILWVTFRAGLDLELGLKNGLGWKNSTPLIGREVREVGTRIFKFTP